MRTGQHGFGTLASKHWKEGGVGIHSLLPHLLPRLLSDMPQLLPRCLVKVHDGTTCRATRFVQKRLRMLTGWAFSGLEWSAGCMCGFSGGLTWSKDSTCDIASLLGSAHPGTHPSPLQPSPRLN